jgi:hypothetical protein
LENVVYRLNLPLKCLYNKPMPYLNVHRGYITVDGKRVEVAVTMMSENAIYSYFHGKPISGNDAKWLYYCPGDIRGLEFSSIDWARVVATTIPVEVPA